MGRRDEDVRQDARGARPCGELRVLQPRRADGGVGERRRDGATVAGCVRYCRPLTSTLMWAQRIAREDLGCKAAAPPPLSTTCGAVRSGESGACAWLAGTDPSQLATAGPDASTGARPSSALIERDSERSPSSAAGAVCRPPMPLAAGPRRSPRRSRRSHRRRRWTSARVCFAAAVCFAATVCARGAATTRHAVRRAGTWPRCLHRGTRRTPRPKRQAGRRHTRRGDGG